MSLPISDLVKILALAYGGVHLIAHPNLQSMVIPGTTMVELTPFFYQNGLINGHLPTSTHHWTTFLDIISQPFKNVSRNDLFLMHVLAYKRL